MPQQSHRRALLAVGLLVALVGGLRARPAAQATGPTPGAASPQTWDPFFDDTVLHEVRLIINSRDWQSLKDHYLDNTYYPSDFKWRDQTVRNVGIRSRGSGSRSGVKPGLRVDFDRYVTDQTFLGLKSFVLRNNTQDATSMHERVSMLLFKRLGAPASKEAHTKLYVNNQYAGLFTIVESVDKTFLKETFGEDEGYLYKYDYPSDAKPYYFEDRGSDPNTYVPLPFKPETHETDAHPEVVARLVHTINETSDAAFRTAIAEFLDLSKFIRHVSIEVFLGDGDGFLGNWGMNNFYFYRFTNTNRFAFIAWDKSNAFLDGWAYSIWRNITDNDATIRNRLMTRALSYPDLKQLYLDDLVEAVNSAAQLEEGRTGGLGWLEREIEKEYAQIRDAALADPDKPFSNEQFEGAVNDLRTFSHKRGEFVTAQVAAARAQ
jgi:spore coat protein CotH